ncbi:MAG TPA: Gfo/Idh/MocA family oxidoreductase [Opitutales bacterium]|nr:Gfo/Idh/MocA family oxidoreductase [Opitutales bacterium]
MSRLTILFAGLGSIGQRHLRNLVGLLPEPPRILAYRMRRDDRIFTDDLQVEAESGLEKKYSIESFTNIADALLQKPDITFVANPTSRHLPVALAAAQAGSHLFIEKPLSHTWAGMEDLFATIERTGRIGYVGYQFRFHPAFEKISHWVKTSRLGNIAAVRAEVGEFMPGFHKYEDYRGTYPARSDLGGGVVLCQIHEYDMFYALFGLPSEVFAVGGKASNLEIDVEDTAQVLFRYPRAGHCDLPVQLHQDFLQRPPRRNFQIIGEAGTIYWDYLGKTLQLFGENGAMIEFENYADLPRNHMFVSEMQHFLACIAGRETPRVNLRDGAQSLRMALAAKESIASGKVVKI